ncbi:MAG: pilus assembly protein TadG-related protein, partial [Planctomycetota bacterium]
MSLLTPRCGTTGQRALTNRSGRRGAIIALVAFLLPALLMVLGFSVDLSYMQATRTELRAATDCAARAAATELSQFDDTTLARNKAKQIAQQHQVAGQPLRLRDGDVVFGRSSPDGNGKWQFIANATPFNAVRVNAARD